MNSNPAILYVEDDIPSVVIMKAIVEKVMKFGSLTVFQSSEGFLENVRLLGFVPDIFLLDIQMKPYSGFDLLEMLRSDPRFKGSRIVALTASVMNEEVDRLKSSGFDGAIAKPLNISAFPGLIQRIIQGDSVWYIA